MGLQRNSASRLAHPPRAAFERRLSMALDSLEPRRLLAAFTVDPAQDLSSTNFHTITDAVTAAAATSETDDTIGVAAGTFAENVAVNTPVTINGAKVGLDARTTRGSGESILTGQFAISAPGVTIDGFTVSGGSSASSPTVAGIYIAAAGAVVRNDIVTGSAGTGILVPSVVPSGTTTLSHNGISGWSTGISVQAAGTTAISDNAITQSTTAGIALDLLANANASTVTIAGNTLSNTGVAQIRLDGGTTSLDSVTLTSNAVTLASGSKFVTSTAPTPLTGLSANTFTVTRAGTEDLSLNIDLGLIDGTDIASLTTIGLAGSASSSGTVATYTPTANFNGTTGFSFATVGGASGVVSLTIAPVNDAPTGTTIPAQSLLEGQSKTVALASYFSDVDGDSLTYSLTNAPSFVSVDASTGVVTIAPNTGNAGSYSFSAAASDGTAAASQPITLVVVRAMNQSPVFSNLPATVNVAENATGTLFTAAATDPDADHLTYSIVAGNSAGHFAIDGATGVVTILSALDAETTATYALTIRVTDDGDPAPAHADATLNVNVTDVNDNATVVTLAGPTSAVEGQSVHYVATASDADVGAVLTYQWFVDNTLQSGATSNTFDTTFASDATHVIKVSVSDRGGPAAADMKSLAVGDAAPTIPVSTSVDHVNEGTAFAITVGGITDPDPSDVAAIGQITINWGDSNITIINSETDPTSLASIRAGQPINSSHTYSDGSNRSQSIVVRAYDVNGNVYSVTTSILVNNVAPTGTFSAITPTISQGSSALVNWFGQTDVSPEDVTAGLRYTYAIDTNNNGTLDATDTLISGDGTYAGSGYSSSVTIPNTLLSNPGTYNILGLLLDKDGSPITTKSVSITVTAGVFRVVSLGGDHSGFTLIFNQKVDPSTIDVYDGNDPSVDLPDVILQKANGTIVKGSVVFNAAGNGFDFIVTGAILPAGTYTVTLRSGATGFHALGGGDLDGDDNGTAGGTYSSTFGVNAPPGPVLSMGDFSRGPGQSVDVIPGTTTSDLPVSINSPIAITSLNFQIRYNASLLTVRPADAANGIADVYAGAGLPAGWTVDYTIGVNVINVSLTRTTTSAASIIGNKELIKIVATVPNNPALYGKSEILSFATIVVNGNASIEGTADRALHKVIFLGDANLDGTVNAADAALIQSIVLGNVTGFDKYPLIDPSIIVDSSRNLVVDSQDATNAALTGFTGGRPTDVPDFTPISLPLSLGADPTYALPSSFAATPGATISVPVSVTDDARGVQAGTLRIYYDTSKFTPAGSPVLAGALLSAGWTILSNVNATDGYVEIAFYSGTALAKSVAAVGTLVTLQFVVAANASDGTSPLTIAAPTGTSATPTGFYNNTGGLFSTTAVSGAIVIDTTPPTATTPTFTFAGNSQSISINFSEDVSASIAAGDFELRNLKTDTLVGLTVASISGDGKTVTLTFANTGGLTNAILKDGDYRFRVLAGQVADKAGNVIANTVESNFFFLNGDANHDRSVDFADLVLLAQHYNTPSGATFAVGDLNYDGKVDFNDLVILAQRYNTTLVAPVPAIVAPRPTATKAKVNRVSDVATLA